MTFHHSDGAERKDRVTVYDENANAYEGDYAAYDYQGPWKAAASVHKSLQGLIYLYIYVYTFGHPK